MGSRLELRAGEQCEYDLTFRPCSPSVVTPQPERRPGGLCGPAFGRSDPPDHTPRVRGGRGNEGAVTASSWRRLVWRGVRWRWRASLVLLGVAVVAVGSGASGPVFLAATESSALVTAVAAAPTTSALTASSQGGWAGQALLTRALRSPPGDRRRHWFAPASLEQQSGVRLSARGQVWGAALVGHSGLCGHVTMVAGRCPDGSGQVAVSTRTAAALGLRDRQRVTLAIPGSARGITVVVVGRYALPATTGSGYWSGGDVFDFGARPTGQPTQVDALLATTPTVLSTAALGDTPQLIATLAVRPSALHGVTAGRLGSDLVSWQSHLADTDHLSVTTGLRGLLRRVSAADGTASTVMGVAVAQLVGLGLLVVFLVVATAAADRREEVELAARRGFTRRQLLGVAVGEPVLVLAAAVPLGLLVAWAAVRGAGAWLFVAGTPVALPWLAVGAAAGVALAGAAAAGVATWDLWRGTRRAAEEATRSRVARAVADATAVALAAAGLSAVSATGALGAGRHDPVAVVAPALLALGGGVIGLRMANGLARLATRATAGRCPVSVFLAVRAVLRRRPAPLRRALALTAAVVLVVFGVNAWATAELNRARVAAVQTGAGVVADVSVPAGVDLSAAVDRADPSGREAMAAEVVRTGSGTTLAVQASRLAEVAAWPRRMSRPSIVAVARYLAAPAAPPIIFTGDRLTAHFSEPAADPALTVTATVLNEKDQDEQTVAFPTVRPGTRAYSAPIDGFCATACRLVDLSPTLANPDATATAPVTLGLQGLEAAGGHGPGALAVHGEQLAAWRTQPSGVTATAVPGGVRFRLPGPDVSSQGVLLSPADTPFPLPAVTTASVLSSDTTTPGSDAVPAVGLDDGLLDTTARVLASTLPEVGGTGVMVDLRYAELSQNGPSQATSQVWLRGPGAARILRRLRSDGVRVTGTQRASSALDRMDHGALALGYVLVLAAGLAAGLLAVGATSYSFLAGARARRRDLHGLIVAGVPPGSIRRGLRVEVGAVVFLAGVVGAATGVVASWIALGSLPQVTGGGDGVPLTRSMLAVPLAATLAVVAVVLAATSVLTAAALFPRSATRARPGKLPPANAAAGLGERPGPEA